MWGRRSIVQFIIVVAISLAVNGSTLAADTLDGVVLISQDAAASGFPIKLTQPGTYRLSGDLIVPTANYTAIIVQSDNVTLDLNGFSIQGPTPCSGFPASCPRPDFGAGVNAGLRENVTVMNGVVRGMGNGVAVGMNSRVIRVLAIGNAMNGIETGDGSLVIDSMAIGNGARGILVCCIVRSSTASYNGLRGIEGTGVATGNYVSTNGGDGIVFQGTVIGNDVRDNSGFGLNFASASPPSGYGNNVLSGNSSGTVKGGVSMGHNVCDGSPC
jgi:hypothetical protein